MTGIKSAIQTIKDLREENEKLRKELADEKEKVERLEYEHNSAFTMAAERAVRISELQKELADERAHAVYLTAFAQEQIAAREESADHVKSLEEALRTARAAMTDLLSNYECGDVPDEVLTGIVRVIDAILSTPKEKAE